MAPKARAGLLLLLLLALLAGCGQPRPKFASTDISGQFPDLQFALTDENGQARTAADFRGKVVLLYFGYTHCPDACPLTLSRIVQLMRQLGPKAAQVVPVFVTVDPQRDTLPVLRKYVGAFDPRLVGLRGDESALTTLEQRYRVYAQRGEGSGNNYLVAHSSGVYVFDGKGHARLYSDSAADIGALTSDIKLLLQGV